MPIWLAVTLSVLVFVLAGILFPLWVNALLGAPLSLVFSMLSGAVGGLIIVALMNSADW